MQERDIETTLISRAPWMEEIARRISSFLGGRMLLWPLHKILVTPGSRQSCVFCNRKLAVLCDFRNRKSLEVCVSRNKSMADPL